MLEPLPSTSRRAKLRLLTCGHHRICWLNYLGTYMGFVYADNLLPGATGDV